ncbi:uncharacterized protein N7482_008820 [Penicillium canariense]|uniref:Calcineurin-like phosphoesterase domain-containing protein n=1 Tax=Penicillium canariense TaxID=189055 RepID=A0A9W9LJD4_9EURO|nr:uncharacterized protein N7482_008820 [Penicillium canariense]KAJ5157720.1 hypothetical protein N7482_008820 [Penicillium canariense]
MSYAYPRSAGASFLPSFSAVPGSKAPGLIGQTLERLPATAQQWFAEGAAGFRGSSRGRSDSHGIMALVLRRLLTVANAIIFMWMFTLWWGERTVFQEAIDRCVWESWEKWPPGATPHHVAFIADPQLVDPHTYPGRPWPLSTLTVKYTDQYMRRSFASIKNDLEPDSVLFLGDLFDGGREWATSKSTSPEVRYKKITDSFWKKEYGRFMRIFLNPWLEQDSPPVDGRGRRLIASLPGNHDLGFGNGIQEPVRRRFQSYFGNGNRVDVIGNHTFVSVDTVSLSAMDQPDPLTGSSRLSEEEGTWPRPIWKDADEFLDAMATHKATAETEELRVLQNKSEDVLFKHHIVEAGDDSVDQLPQPKPAGFPTIILTHVPLYRKPATPCGPLRERLPPSAPGLEEDEPNSLRIAGGYQYQNVLTQTISTELVSKAGPNVVQVYSGDDHDYCELTHREFNGSPNEITVKSLSWAMGVRHPGFLLTSLWNPIDPVTGESTQKGSSPTIQNHLCLLPDQLGIFIHYACLFGLSIGLLFLQAIYSVFFSPESPTPASGSVLPLSERRTSHPNQQYQTSGTSSSTFPSGGLIGRAGVIPFPRYPGSKTSGDTYRGLDGDAAASTIKAKGLYRPAVAAKGVCSKAVLVGREFARSVRSVLLVVLAVYFVLIWRW